MLKITEKINCHEKLILGLTILSFTWCKIKDYAYLPWDTCFVPHTNYQFTYYNSLFNS